MQIFPAAAPTMTGWRSIREMNNSNYLKGLLIVLLMAPAGLMAQLGSVSGVVMTEQQGEQAPLVGASVYWLGTSVGTATDGEGGFELERVASTDQLITTYAGYQPDTTDVSGQDKVTIHIRSSITLEEVEVTHRKKSTEISFLDPQKTQRIGEKELLKAACCNLSESFETSPSVDVSFTDAVTGTRQIQMLGLAGPYTQITRENMPDIRGLSAIYGLTYVPGHWVEGIHLIKGPGSVANGFESIAGQINVDLRNPASMDKVYLNAYANEGGRYEVNANLKADVGKRWGTGLLLHGVLHQVRLDRNDDSFMDMPLHKNLIALNRWEYYSDKGLHLQLAAKGTLMDHIGGQMAFNPVEDEGTTNVWGMSLETERLELWGKLGKVNQEKPYQTYGLQVQGVTHHQNTFFGISNHEASQQSFYANAMFQSIFGNTNHKWKAGASFQYDAYNEVLNDRVFDRIESVPGAFFEYTFSHLEVFNLVTGLRADYHNLFGLFLTPRLHARYALSERTVFRASVGRGLRTANIIAENHGLLASSREIVIEGDGSNKPYGLEAEKAWNYGINLTQTFRLDYREGTIQLDFYRTDFENQVVVDVDRSPQQAIFYNLDGRSFSNSFQAQVDYEVLPRLDARLAYRWFDVKTTYDGVLRQKPLVSSHRAFINMAYETRNYWKFDATLNWQGQKRIPITSGNPAEYQLPENSPHFVMVNTQISKKWWEKFEVYLGVENVLNYTQEDPILASGDPFGDYFDSSLVWGPIFGRNVYAGLRYKIR